MSNSYETTKLNVALDSTRFKDITPPKMFGASIVCQKHDIFIVFAENSKQAHDKFYENKFFRLSAGDYRIIQDNQDGSKKDRVFAICLGADEDTTNVAKAVAVVDGGTAPETVDIQTNVDPHNLVVGEFVTISGTDSYDGVFEIIALPATDEITIFRNYIAENLAITDTIKQYPTVEINYIAGE